MRAGNHRMASIRITNKQARRLWLHGHGLATPPTGPLNLLQIIEQLGFVQLDSIQVVARAHHHILWSRNHHYREPMFDTLLAEDRAVFEHFTHDASVLPMRFLPYWQRQFDRKRTEMHTRWATGLPTPEICAHIKDRIRQEGPLSTHAFDTKTARPGQMWARPPHKLALDYMWYAGELATAHRINFNKYYDLADRVYPADLHGVNIPDEASVDWLCQNALDRLQVATLGEIKRFWDAVTTREATAWAQRCGTHVTPVDIQSADGSWTTALAPVDIEDRIARARPATSRLRILNPFDPAIRDRVRLARLFGFDYRVEMFVPAAKRIWGYYVFPILEGDRFIGRIEVKGDRKAGTLTVLKFWPEPGIDWTAHHSQKVQSELERMRRFIGVKIVCWDCDLAG